MEHANRSNLNLDHTIPGRPFLRSVRPITRPAGIVCIGATTMADWFYPSDDMLSARGAGRDDRDAEVSELESQISDLEEIVENLQASIRDFGGYAKTLMTDSHVTADYLDGYREKFRKFEQVYNDSLTSAMDPTDG